MKSKPTGSFPLRLALLLVVLGLVVMIGAAGVRALGYSVQPSSSASPSTDAQRPVRPMPPGPLGLGPPAHRQPESTRMLAATLPTVTPTEEPAPSPTVMATPAPPTPTSSVGPTQAGAAVALTGFRHEWQTWNNCGPATLAMVLSYYGSAQNQAEIGSILRQFPDDKNVSPSELADYARSQGFHAQVRVDGSADQARLFLSNGIPLLIETWLDPEDYGGLGHYRLLTGYDDNTQNWIAYDSYVSENLVNTGEPHYQGIRLPYAETSQLWSVFNHIYVLIYPPAQEPLIRAILDHTFDEEIMWQEAAANAQAVAEQNPTNPFAWFNLGSNLVHLGRYVDAALAYDRARELGLPWRMLWYQFGPFAAYYEVGRYADVIALADATLAGTQGIEEIYYWKGQALAALGNHAEARLAWTRALELNPSYTAASTARQSLPN